MAGLAVARAASRTGGRRPKLSEQVAMMRQMHASGKHTIADIAETFKVTRPTVYRVLK